MILKNAIQSKYTVIEFSMRKCFVFIVKIDVADDDPRIYNIVSSIVLQAEADVAQMESLQGDPTALGHQDPIK